jgi:hypothetical protein
MKERLRGLELEVGIGRKGSVGELRIDIDTGVQKG